MTAPALARCVGDVDLFLADRFASVPHRWRSDPFEDLLSLADVDGLLTGAGIRRPVVRLVRDGEPVDPSTWTKRARTGGATVDDIVHAGRVLAHFADGATVVLQSLHRWWPPLTAFCRDLQSAIGHPVQANAYLTPAGAAGLAPHHDTHDVFVLQVHGTKRWTVRAPLVEAPLERHRSQHGEAAASPVLFEADVHPGDCLYLPRGFVHSAAAQDGVSLHVTIGVLATTAHDVLRRLVDLAAEEPSFRRTLPPAFASDGGAAASVVKGVVADFLSWAAGVEPTAVAAAVVDRRSRPAPMLGGQLLQLAALAAVDDRTTVVVRDAGATELVVDDGVRLVLGDRTVELPAAVAGVVARLLDGEEHQVSDLADAMDARSRLVLARRLVREGALRTVHGA